MLFCDSISIISEAILENNYMFIQLLVAYNFLLNPILQIHANEINQYKNDPKSLIEFMKNSMNQAKNESNELYDPLNQNICIIQKIWPVISKTLSINQNLTFKTYTKYILNNGNNLFFELFMSLFEHNIYTDLLSKLLNIHAKVLNRYFTLCSFIHFKPIVSKCLGSLETDLIITKVIIQNFYEPILDFDYKIGHFLQNVFKMDPSLKYIKLQCILSFLSELTAYGISWNQTEMSLFLYHIPVHMLYEYGKIIQCTQSTQSILMNHKSICMAFIAISHYTFTNIHSLKTELWMIQFYKELDDKIHFHHYLNIFDEAIFKRIYCIETCKNIWKNIMDSLNKLEIVSFIEYILNLEKYEFFIHIVMESMLINIMLTDKFIDISLHHLLQYIQISEEMLMKNDINISSILMTILNHYYGIDMSSIPINMDLFDAFNEYIPIVQ